jgi:hypothetical protein
MAGELKFAQSICELVSLLINIKDIQNNNNSQLNELINQTYSRFETIHNEYLDSFRKYRECIKSSKYPLDQNNPILEMIETDHKFTNDKRTTIIKMAETARDKIPKGNTRIRLDNFTYSIIIYLLNSRVIQAEYLQTSNVWRTSLLNELNFIFALDNSSDMESWFKAIFPRHAEDDISGERFHLDERMVKSIIHDEYKRFKIDENDPEKVEKLKMALAMQSIDHIVVDMQMVSQLVTDNYLKLKK